MSFIQGSKIQPFFENAHNYKWSQSSEDKGKKNEFNYFLIEDVKSKIFSRL